MAYSPISDTIAIVSGLRVVVAIFDEATEPKEEHRQLGIKLPVLAAILQRLESQFHPYASGAYAGSIEKAIQACHEFMIRLRFLLEGCKPNAIRRKTRWSRISQVGRSLQWHFKNREIDFFCSKLDQGISTLNMLHDVCVKTKTVDGHQYRSVLYHGWSSPFAGNGWTGGMPREALRYEVAHVISPLQRIFGADKAQLFRQQIFYCLHDQLTRRIPFTGSRKAARKSWYH